MALEDQERRCAGKAKILRKVFDVDKVRGGASMTPTLSPWMHGQTTEHQHMNCRKTRISIGSLCLIGVGELHFHVVLSHRLP